MRLTGTGLALRLGKRLPAFKLERSEHMTPESMAFPQLDTDNHSKGFDATRRSPPKTELRGALVLRCVCPSSLVFPGSSAPWPCFLGHGEKCSFPLPISFPLFEDCRWNPGLCTRWASTLLPGHASPIQQSMDSKKASRNTPTPLWAGARVS